MGLFDSIAGLFDPTATGDGSILSTLAGDVFGATDTVGGLVVPGALPVSYPSYSLNDYPGSISSASPGYAQPTMAASGQITSVITYGSQVIRGIGLKIAQKLGLRAIPSLQKMMRMIRSMAKNGLAPAAVATALGIGVDELARVITESSRRKRRRMNVANTRALRRSVRRLAGFERLAHRVTAQLGSLAHRRRGSSRRCFKCRKSPCSC